MNKLKLTCYLDLDGVIGDWESQAIKAIGGQPVHSIPKKELWQRITEYDTTVEKFFENIPKMPYADRLVNYLKDSFESLIILTASGFTPKDVKQQKIKWVKHHYPDLEVIVVQKSVDKAQYANNESILIDDRDVSINAWTETGAVGILHTTFENTYNAVEWIKQYG